MMKEKLVSYRDFPYGIKREGLCDPQSRAI